MFSQSSGAWMPADLSTPAIWKAFAAVTSGTPWRITTPGLDPVTFGIDFDADFQAHLDGAGTFDFGAKARGAIATRILDIALSLSEQLLRRKGFDPELMATSPVVSGQAEEALKAYVINKIRNELNQRCDPGASAWADEVERELLGVSLEARETLRRYFGFDRRLDGKAIRKGSNYVFKSMDLQVRSWSGGACVIGNSRKLNEVRDARNSPDPKCRARHQVLCGIEKILPAASSSSAVLNHDMDALEVCRLVLEERVRLHGPWGLIDLTIGDDRGDQDPIELGTGRLQELAEKQDQRGAALTEEILEGMGSMMPGALSSR